MRWTGITAAALLSIALPATSTDAGVVPTKRPTSLRDCDAAVRAQPKDLASWQCYRVLFASDPGRWRGPITRRFERVLASDPINARAKLFLALLTYDSETTWRDSEELYREAAEGLHAEEEFTGEVIARTGLEKLLCDLGRFREAEADIVRSREAARRSGDPDMVSQATIYTAYCAYSAGDFGRAAVLYNEARSHVLASNYQFTKFMLLDGLGAVYSALGRHREAFEIYRQEVDVFESRPQIRAGARHNVAFEAVRLADEGELDWAEADRLIREALDEEVRTGSRVMNHGGERHTRLLLARRLGATPQGFAQLRNALKISDPGSDPEVFCGASRLLAKFEIDIDPSAPSNPLRRIMRSIQLARDTGSLPDIARGALARAYVRWKSGARDQAISDSLAALNEFDRVRNLQPEPMVRARTASEFAFAYHLIAGYLVDPAHGRASPDDVALSFEVMERLRARTLLDLLALGRAAPEGPLQEERTALLGRLSGVQRRLANPKIPPEERAALLAQLDRLEAEEEALRDRISRSRPRPSWTAAPVSLQELQSALAPDQAVLAFQSWRRQSGGDAPYEDGSSWLMAITSDAVRPYRVPDADALHKSVAVFRALIERRDGAEVDGAARLYRELLKPALHELPAQIRRLVLIPDGALHSLAFEALRESPGAPALAERFEISIAPSAALWLHWKRSVVAAAPRAALVIADPATEAGRAGAERQASPLLSGLHLGSLPFGREEAFSVARALGPGTRVLVGDEASERSLKQLDLRNYAILHFAAHAVVDEEKPERSAIVLAAGSPEEDGLLQMRELVDLDLSGRVAVLATCRSSSGALIRGEGVMSLARAFFEAGGRAVIGSLWPVRDDEAAALFSSFYRHLGAGRSLAAAMAEARRERIRAGAPAAAWAGLSVLGDGDVVPLPASARRSSPAWVAWSLAAAGAMALSLLAVRKRVHGRRRN